MYKKITLSVAVLALTLLPAITLAQGVIENTVETADSAGYESTGIDVQLAEVAGGIVRAFLSLLGIIFISYTIYGGYLWMTAAGREDMVAKAQRIIRQGIIGIIIVFSASAIYFLIEAVFVGGSNGNFPMAG